MILILHIFLLLFLSFSPGNGFREKQLKYERVRQAYLEKEKPLQAQLAGQGLDFATLEICLLAYKREKQLEVWARNHRDSSFVFFKNYRICYLSGRVGPKRKEGDKQVPEGIYHINFFNPESDFHLSLGINYPNASDRVLSDKLKPGGSIFIHGNCVSIGCIPITDDKIKELYILSVEATQSGQEKIPVVIFPARMTPENQAQLKRGFHGKEEVLELWEVLSDIYTHFDLHHILPEIEFLPDGKPQILN